MEVDSPSFELEKLPTELQEKVMDSCDMETMTALGRTSKIWDRKRNDCIYHRVINLLKYFLLDPLPFLEFLTRTKSVISGSAALLVFSPGLFIPGDLDIYCTEDMFDEVLDFFTTFTEYREPEERPTGEELAKDVEYDAWVFSENHLSKVLKLSCSPPPDSEDTELKLVNIIAVRRIKTISAISHFHSTPVMNIITGTGAVCVYPELTLRMRGIINTSRQTMASTEKFANCLDKYRERGFDLAMTLGKWPRMRPDFARTKPLKDIPVCAIAFPTASGERILKKGALEENLWNLEWELSEWKIE